MKRIILSIFIITVLNVGTALSQNGRQVSFVMQSDTVIHAILLVADDSVCYVDTVRSRLSEKNAVRLSDVHALPISDIRYVWGHDQQSGGPGIVTMGLLGAAVGGGIGHATYEEPKQTGIINLNFGSGPRVILGALIGGASGLLVGAIVDTASDENLLIVPTDRDGTTQLREIALYEKRIRIHE